MTLKLIIRQFKTVHLTQKTLIKTLNVLFNHSYQKCTIQLDLDCWEKCNLSHSYYLRTIPFITNRPFKWVKYISEYRQFFFMFDVCSNFENYNFLTRLINIMPFFIHMYGLVFKRNDKVLLLVYKVGKTKKTTTCEHRIRINI